MEFNARISAADRAQVEDVVKDAVQKGQDQADGYNAFAAGAMLQARFSTAAWGALKAASLEWNPTYVANVAVYLIYLNRLDEADAFLRCARDMDPRSPFVIEALAMLAHQRKDCVNATHLIKEAMQLLPGDMNVRYTAGIIHSKCGDRAKAKQYLLMAREQMPDDKTVQQALKVVDPAWQAPSPPKDELGNLTEECFRFLDEMVTRGELASRIRNQIEEAQRPGLPQDYAKELREDVERSKREIAKLEKTARDSAGRPNPFDWNSALYNCVVAYITAVYDYRQIFAGSGIEELSLMAQAMRTDPVLLAQRMRAGYRGDYLNQDKDKKYFDALALVPWDDGYCAKALSLWQPFRAAVLANMRAAEAGFPSAAENYANYWLSFALRASDYSRRAVAAMKPSPDGSHKRLPELVKSRYKSTIGEFTINAVATFLIKTRRGLVEELDRAAEQAAKAPPRVTPPRGSCGSAEPEKVNLEAGLEKLIAALNEASKVEGGPTGFDCEVKAGAFGVSIKSKGGRHLEVKVSEKVGMTTYAVSGTTENRTGLDRFGVEGSYGESGISAEGVAVKGSVKLWGEGRANGKIDYGAQVEGKLGLGVNMMGSTTACYLVQAKVRFNARVFAEVLVS